MNNAVLNTVKTELYPDARVNMKKMAEGKNGVVYSVKQHPGRVVKVRQSKNKEALETEEEITVMASKAGIGAEIFRTAVLRHSQTYILVIEMEQMDGTLADYLNKPGANSTYAILQVQHLVMLLHDLDICHKDLHMNNIMYKTTFTGEVQFKLIDFSRAEIGANCAENRNALNKYKQRAAKRPRSSSGNAGPQSVASRELANEDFFTP